MQSRKLLKNRQYRDRESQIASCWTTSTRGRLAISAWRLLPCLALLSSLGLPSAAHADGSSALLAASILGAPERQGPPNDQGGQGGAEDANSGPVRLARFSNVTGDVTWRDSTDGSWSPAGQNMPLRQGAQIWVADGSRAEVQFDDGSRVRLDSNTLITLQTLFSDADGEFTEITLNDGRVYLRLNNKYSLYQVNTPQASLKATGPAQIRVGGGKAAEFGVRSGAATIEGTGGKADLHAGDFLAVTDGNAEYRVEELPRPDSWDTWNLSRDEAIDNAGRSLAPHLPSNIALVSDNLDEDGSWHNDPQYGWIWSPRVSDPEWRPYRAGHWTWVEPFGWTWVSTERWGWAPYHYGTWVHQSYGWGWCPGPSVQYWSPGVVSFTENAGVMAWCPLAPAEVRYPSRLAIGFRGGNWSAFFSIGGTAVYYPTGNRYCEPRPFRNVYVNRVTYVNHVTNVYNVTNITVNRNTYLTGGRFVPANARWQGGTQVAVESFGGRGVYRSVPGGAQNIFAQGRVIAGPTSGRPVAGPQSVRVTAASLTPTRVYHAPTALPQQAINRTVYRASLPTNVPHIQSQPQTGQRFTNRLNGPTSGNPGVTSRTGGQPNLPGRPTDGKATFDPRNNTTGNNTNGSNGSGRRNDGNVSTTTKTNGATGNTSGRSSGLDDYLKNRKNGTGNGNVTGQTGSGKPPITGGKTDTTTHRYGDGSNTTRTDTNGRRYGDTSNGSKTDTTRRNGDSPNGTGTGSGKTNRYGDGSNGTGTGSGKTNRYSDGSNGNGTDRTHRTGDSSTGTKTDTTRRSGDTSNGSKTDTTRRNGSGSTGSSDTHTPRSGGGNSSGKSDTGKSGTSKTDTKSTDTKKDNPSKDNSSKDNSKDHKNP